MIDIPRIKFLAQRRYRANWPFLDGHELGCVEIGRSMLMLGIAESADQGDKLAGKPCPTDFFILTRKATANLIEVFSLLKNGGGMGMTAHDGVE